MTLPFDPTLLERIKQLETQARSLEPGPAEREAMLEQVSGYGETFLRQIDDMPAFQVTADQGLGLLDSPLSEEPLDLSAALDLLAQQVDRPGVAPGSGGYLAYIPGGGLYPSALGDYLAALTNRYAGVFFASPGAVRLERMLLAWIAEFLGYPESAAGDLTSGGSIANLIGIVTAREARGLKAREIERTVVYLSAQTHHCIDKALRIAGLGECLRRIIPLDERYRMRPEALDQAVRADKAAGLNPWLVIATAGSTDVGAVDPLATIAELAAQHGLWCHVDGAYGAAFALCEPGKEKLRGIERSDSVVIDPHKGLFLPYGSGAALVRQGAALQQAHYYQASYMQDRDSLESEQLPSPADLSPELSRPFRGLRLWLPLKLFGLAPFRAALEEKLLLARYFHRRLAELPGFEVGPPPDLSVVIYRYRPQHGDVNAFNQALIRAVQADGRVFLSSTTIDGQVMLRLAVLGFRSHRRHIEEAIDILRSQARRLEEG